MYIISCCFVIHLASSCLFFFFFCMNIKYQIYILERLPNDLWLGALSIHLSWLPMVATMPVINDCQIKASIIIY